MTDYDMNENRIQDLSHFYNDETFDWLKKKSESYIRLMSYYKCAMMEIETKLNVLNEEYSLEYDRNPISNIKTRLKRLQSIREKLDRQNLPQPLNQ